MSKVSKMVFAAFMQHCIQSTVTHLTHVEEVEDAKYYCTVLCIQGLLRRQLCFKTFWDFSNYKGDCRQDAQPISNS